MKWQICLDKKDSAKAKNLRCIMTLGLSTMSRHGLPACGGLSPSCFRETDTFSSELSMALLKSRTCSVCGRAYIWKIERPGDGYWDRWRNDDGDTLSSWFVTNNLCWNHAFERMPERFRSLIRTEFYEEPAPSSAAQEQSDKRSTP